MLVALAAEMISTNADVLLTGDAFGCASKSCAPDVRTACCDPKLEVSADPMFVYKVVVLWILLEARL